MPNSFLQSPAWFQFQQAYGRQVVGSFIRYPLPFKQSYWFTPYGPTVDTTPTQWQAQLQVLPKGPLFVRFEPVVNQYGGKRVSDIHPSKTLVTALGADQAMLAAMKPKCRYNIKVAEKHQVTVTTSADVDAVYTLLSDTAKRQQIRLHPKEYYRLMVEVLGKHSMLNIYTASYHNQPIATAIIIYYQGVATYLHGGSSHVHKNVMAPYALHWQIMRDAYQQGYQTYDWFGISDRWPGVTRFKESFGGNLVERPGTFEQPLKPIWYTAYRMVKRLWTS